MAKYSIDGSTLTGIADAVRELDENDSGMTPAQMRSRVAAVSSRWKSKVSALSDILGIEAYEYDNTATYEVGDYCVHEGSLHICCAEIGTAEEWISEHWTEIDVISELKSLLDEKVGFEDYATANKSGVVKVSGIGVQIWSDGVIGTSPANSNVIKAGSSQYSPITPQRQHESIFYGLAKAAGDTTQASSSNAVGSYTDNAKTAIKSMLGVETTVNVPGTAPTITATANTMYICGEVLSLDFTPCASGICGVRFTSGSTATILTLPSGVHLPGWFDAADLEANTVYEMSFLDGYGVVMAWEA